MSLGALIVANGATDIGYNVMGLEDPLRRHERLSDFLRMFGIKEAIQLNGFDPEIRLMLDGTICLVPGFMLPSAHPENESEKPFSELAAKIEHFIGVPVQWENLQILVRQPKADTVERLQSFIKRYQYGDTDNGMKLRRNSHAGI